MKKTYVGIRTGTAMLNSEIVGNIVVGQLIELEETVAAGIPEFVTASDDWKNVLSEDKVDEAQTSTSTTMVSTTFTVFEVTGVWLATDTLHTGTNYYTGGSFSGKDITLGSALPGATTNVIINYRGSGMSVGTGAEVAYSKTLDSLTPGKKLMKLAFTVPATKTMAAGTTVIARFYDASSSLIGTKNFVMGAVAATTYNVWFSASEFIKATKVVISGLLKRGTAYTVDCVATLYDLTKTADGVIQVTATGLSSLAQTVSFQFVDSDGSNMTNCGILKAYISTTPLGTAVAAATVLNGIAKGTDGDIVEMVDDIYFTAISEEDGDFDVTLTMTDGTPTYNELTISVGVPSNGETVTIGTEVYEFNTGAVTAGRIKVDTTGMTTVTHAAAGLKAAINSNTAYSIAADNSSGVLSITATRYFYEYNTLATTETGANMAWADSTFGGGTGASTPGVDPTAKFWIIFELPDGTRCSSNVLPYVY